MTVEVAGHSPSPRALSVTPNSVLVLAGQVVHQCPGVRQEIGGFGTLGLSDVLKYTGTGQDFTQNVQQPWPSNIAFLTVSATPSNMQTNYPGDTDPAIPLGFAVASGVDPTVHDNLVRTAASMQRGGTTPWWNLQTDSSDGQVHYECDTWLGNPSANDCTQIEWSQLEPAGSDSVVVGPQSPTFLHQNTCFLAISSTSSIILTWTQIQTAVEALVNICIQAPVEAASGGRAFYEQTPAKRTNRERRDGGITGLNALPPGVTIYIFEQQETWINNVAELTSCTWEAVFKQLPVSRCAT